MNYVNVEVVFTEIYIYFDTFTKDIPMENKVLIIQNSHEGPGIIARVLKEKCIEFDLADLNEGDVFPPVQDYKCIFILGGPDSANDQSEKMINEMAKIHEALENNIPVLGICLGCQILVKLVGGKVLPGGQPEIGLKDPDGKPFQVHLTETGRQDPLFRGLDSTLSVFELHGEVIVLNSNVELLGAGSFIRNQIVKVAEKSYGILCHFEAIPEEVEGWLSVDPMFDAIDKQELIEDFKSMRDVYRANGKKIFENYMEIVGF